MILISQSSKEKKKNETSVKIKLFVHVVTCRRTCYNYGCACVSSLTSAEFAGEMLERRTILHGLRWRAKITVYHKYMIIK